MNVRFKKTENGEVAILPRKDYEALVVRAAEADENAGTARLVRQARKAIAGGAPLVPKLILEQIVKGGSALRILRDWRNLTQIDLSSRASLGQGYISDIENGRRTGTTAALKKIAKALNVPVELLV